MNKGLEAFLIPTMNGLEKVVRYSDIEKELKDKEKFEELVNMDLDLFMKAVDIKCLIEDYQKFKKALEIIKEKRVDVNSLIIEIETEEECGKKYYNALKHYNKCVIHEILTQEEYDLLKEVLL